MSSHGRAKRGRRITSNRVWIEPEMNEELDARKLGRAFLALALHRAAAEAEAQSEHAGDFGDGGNDESA
jgi:hypothetical protein